MNAVTKIIVLLIIILRLMGSGVGIGDFGYGAQLVILSHVLFLGLIVYLLADLKKSFLIYSALLLLFLIGYIGVFFRIMHWPGGGGMHLLGSVGGIATGAILVWNSFKSKKTSLVHLISGICIIIQFSIPFAYTSYEVDWYLSLLNYPIFALACTILLNQQEKNKGERYILVVVALQALLYIIKHAITLL